LLRKRRKTLRVHFFAAPCRHTSLIAVNNRALSPTIRLIVFEKYSTATRLQRRSCFWCCKKFLLRLGADWYAITGLEGENVLCTQKAGGKRPAGGNVRGGNARSWKAQQANVRLPTETILHELSAKAKLQSYILISFTFTSYINWHFWSQLKFNRANAASRKRFFFYFLHSPVIWPIFCSFAKWQVYAKLFRQLLLSSVRVPYVVFACDVAEHLQVFSAICCFA